MPEVKSTSLPEEFRHGMHVVITGSGSALPDPARGGASQAVIIDGVVLLFDCGRMVTENLLRAGVNPASVTALFFTHHHFDHIGSYGYFVISSWIAGRQDKMQVSGPRGTVAMSEGAIHGACSPRPRGWSLSWIDKSLGHPVLPAPAGMVHARDLAWVEPFGSPRTLMEITEFPRLNRLPHLVERWTRGPGPPAS